MDNVTTTETPPAEVTSKQFRHVAGHFASGVTVISTAVDGRLFGTTASAVCSLSLEPPMMLVCLNTTSASHDAVIAAGVFGISILASDQGGLAYHFGRRGADKFVTVPHRIATAGVPVLDGGLATIVCEVESRVTGGTHTVFLGRVIEGETYDREPLAYYRGRLGRLAESAELSTYEGVRAAVLRRETPLGEAIDIEALAGTVGSDAQQVKSALIRLTAEGLVDRLGEDWLPAPITAALVAANYAARMGIETRVLESWFTTIDDDVRERLMALGAEMARVKTEEPSGLEEYLRLHAEYHVLLVGLSGSEQLVESYRRLSLGTVWRQGLTEAEWRAELDHQHIERLTESLVRGDLDAAKRVIAEHAGVATALAERVIARVGGVV